MSVAVLLSAVSLAGPPADVQRAVCHYWKPCDGALRVVNCETGGTYSVWAGYPKGRYWGLFQMGRDERARWGHGWNAWTQARAAWRYWLTAGWRPWPTCGALA